jgi:hypothetical protein
MSSDFDALPVTYNALDGPGAGLGSKRCWRGRPVGGFGQSVAEAR